MKVERKNIEPKSGMDNRASGEYDFDDLVFENRNREYGAYQLRKGYNRVLLTGLIVAVTIVTASVIIPFISHPGDAVVIGPGSGYRSVRMENLTPPEEIYIPPSAPPPRQQPIEEAAKYVPPVVVDSVPEIEPLPLSTDEILATQEGEIIETIGSGAGDGLFEGDGEGTLEEPLFQVEVMPTFRGGDLTKFREWVGKRTNYPQAAIDSKIRGTVFLTFVVEKDGSVSSVTVTKGVHPLLDSEAIKAISESPKWTPGLQRGQPVRVRFLIPLSFIY